MGELLGRMNGACRPSQSNVGEPVAVGDHASEGLVSRHSVGAPAVQSRDQPVQLVALLLEVAGGGRPVLLGDEIALAPGGSKLLQHAGLLRLGGVDLKTVVAKSDRVHTLPNDFQRCRLLGDEEHSLAVREAIGDGVGDGLAFAGARRAEQDKVGPALGCDHGGDLRRIGRKWREQVDRVDDLVDRAGINEAATRRSFVGVCRRVDQVRHYRIALEQVGAVNEVLPHQVFGERQRRERDLLGDFPALNAFDVTADGLPNAGNVDAGSVLRQFAVEFGHRQVEILLQHLHQGRIEARFVLMQRQSKSGTHAFALELHRDEDQRRPVRARTVLRRPFQETQAEVEDVSATFFEGEPGGSVEIGEASF